MLHDPTDAASRDPRDPGEKRDAGISDDELSVALRAAGASSEDVQRYLKGDKLRSPDHG